MRFLDCDPASGSCQVSHSGHSTAQTARHFSGEVTVKYIGDPMCSWCWGISPALEELARYCEQKQIGFTLTMGGLRAGGGDPWVPAFQAFLRQEWTHVAKVTGQPFGFSLLAAKYFDYDTEPACRAVVIAEQISAQQGLVASATLAFFSAVQRKFYVEGEDPKDVSFYRSICEDASISFDEFRSRFTTAAAQSAVYEQFTQCQAWGVRSFPTLLLEVGGDLKQLNSGATTAAATIARIEHLMSTGENSHVAPREI
ncbi:protein-disulfide isomerase [Pseudomonas sp. CVAP|uniref:DsbA family protein n=1 Tax=Pseudomonas sp. CVAP\|nr:protein-disulfide isomerase [Pseudomonas sp. CVAP\